ERLALQDAARANQRGSANTTTVGAPGFLSTQKFDGLPDATAMYCLPPAAYVMMPPPTGPPVLNRYNTAPLRASNTTKSPVNSPVSTRLPAVVVTAATIGRVDLYFHFTAPVEASTAVSQPCAFSGGSRSVLPPMYSLPGMYRTCSNDENVAHQSTAGTYSRFVPPLYAGPFHWLPPST